MSNKNYIYTYIYTFYYYLYTFFPPLKFISLFKIAQIDVAPTFLIFQKIWRPLFKLNLKKSSLHSKWIAPLFFPIQTSRLLARISETARFIREFWKGPRRVPIREPISSSFPSQQSHFRECALLQWGIEGNSRHASFRDAGRQFLCPSK